MFTGPASEISLLALIYMLYIFSVLSRKLGSVTKMKPLYRTFYYASGVIGLAIVVNGFLQTSRATPLSLNDDTPYLIGLDCALSVALTVSVFVAWRYWGWLFKEHDR